MCDGQTSSINPCAACITCPRQASTNSSLVSSLSTRLLRLEMRISVWRCSSLSPKAAKKGGEKRSITILKRPCEASLGGGKSKADAKCKKKATCTDRALQSLPSLPSGEAVPLTQVKSQNASSAVRTSSPLGVGFVRSGHMAVYTIFSQSLNSLVEMKP